MRKIRVILEADLTSNKYKLKSGAVKSLGDFSVSLVASEVDFLFDYLRQKASFISHQYENYLLIHFSVFIVVF